MPRKPLSKEKRTLVINGLNSGLPVEQVRKSVNVSSRTLYKVANEAGITRYQKHEKVTDPIVRQASPFVDIKVSRNGRTESFALNAF